MDEGGHPDAWVAQAFQRTQLSNQIVKGKATDLGKLRQAPTNMLINSCDCCANCSITKALTRSSFLYTWAQLMMLGKLESHLAELILMAGITCCKRQRASIQRRQLHTRQQWLGANT